MEEGLLLKIVIAIVVLDFVIERALEMLNIKNLKEDLPKALVGIYDPDKYKKSIQYSRENSRFALLTSTVSFIVIVVLLTTGFFGWFDGYIRSFIHNETVISLSFFGILFIISDVLNTPFQWYSTFVIEQKYGFNKTTPQLFVIDKLKGYLLTAIMGGGVLFVLLKLLQYFGPSFWLYFWGVMVAFALFMNMFYTSLILPMFNKLAPLEDGTLKQKLEAYATKVKFPLHNIFVIDGSKRSNKSNAFFSGLGKKKKVVLYDTLINNHTEDEIVAILAHEIGHYKKKHIIYSFMISVLQMGILLYFMSLLVFNESFSLALGGKQLAMHLNLIVLTVLFSPVSHFTGILFNMLSRKNEYQADAYAKKTFDGEALKSALKKLSVHNLSNLTPHPAYVFVHYSHPTLLQRLKAIER